VARVAEQASLYPDAGYWTLEDYFREIRTSVRRNVNIDRTTSFTREVGMMVEKRFIAHLIKLAARKDISERVRAGAMAELYWIEGQISITDNFVNGLSGHRYYLDQTIKQFLADPGSVEVSPAPALPDGSPIGCGGLH